MANKPKSTEELLQTAIKLTRSEFNIITTMATQNNRSFKNQVETIIKEYLKNNTQLTQD